MAVETKEQIFLLLDQSDEKLKKFGVKRCGLFGSFLRDRQNLQSQVGRAQDVPDMLSPIP